MSAGEDLRRMVQRKDYRYSSAVEILRKVCNMRLKHIAGIC